MQWRFCALAAGNSDQPPISDNLQASYPLFRVIAIGLPQAQNYFARNLLAVFDIHLKKLPRALCQADQSDFPRIWKWLGQSHVELCRWTKHSTGSLMFV